ncbi:hypothetical protein CEP54_004005 [Fusarium duplospermum]|uniref:Uncharacterized protein n=1 Tax=Fusarium duplospermum TaxID=1325734 RepID=A0A428QLH0_9HYPO|nr:hypothetical protein CEP54_004005 [Fusarium duplospermum]
MPASSSSSSSSKFLELLQKSDEMFDYTNIHHVFSSEATNPYDRKAQSDIEACRKSFDGALFIDRVLRAVGITKGRL